MKAVGHRPLKVLVTGANGFVGRRVCAELERQGHTVRGAVRDMSRAEGLTGEIVPVGELQNAAWTHALSHIDAVVHLAARVHVMKETAADPLQAFRADNVRATEALALAAVAKGVKRFVYVSSIKVNGEGGAQPFSADDPAQPSDPYGVSKWEAEQRLRCLAAETGVEVTVVRPPLVYGPGVGGNFLRLLQLVRRGIPLPFGAIQNRRSMIYNGNLADALIACAVHPDAAGKTYLVSDGEDLSTPELVRRLAAAMGKPARLVPVPAGVLRLAGALTGKGAEIDRLIGSLRVDTNRIRQDIGWTAPYPASQGVHETVAWFCSRAS